MKKILCLIIGLFLIFLVISAGCVRVPEGDPAGSQRAPGKGSTANPKDTVQTAIPTPVIPNFKINQVALKTGGASSGLAIVDYNNITRQYGTLPVSKNSRGDGWHTKGYQLIEWRNISQIDSQYRAVLSYTIPPNSITDHDPTARELLPITSLACYLVGDWSVNKGSSVYKFRLDNIVVKQTGNQIDVGYWDSIRSTVQTSRPPQSHEGYRTFVIKWNYGPSLDHPNYIEKITLSADLSKISGVNNYGEKTMDGTWLGLVPSWKGEAVKAGSVKARDDILKTSDCTKWIGGGEWWKN